MYVDQSPRGQAAAAAPSAAEQVHANERGKQELIEQGGRRRVDRYLCTVTTLFVIILVIGQKFRENTYFFEGQKSFLGQKGAIRKRLSCIHCNPSCRSARRGAIK